jgi:hypothetical protein
MTNARLSLNQLVRGLERYDGKYDALEIFVDDVEELHALRRGEQLPTQLEARADGKDLVFKVSEKPYRMSISEKSGTARITRGAAADGGTDLTVLGGIVGTAIGHATGSKGDGWVPGLVLGLLAGHALDNEKKQRTIAVRYDAETGEWRAYGGPMSQWMRQQAAS